MKLWYGTLLGTFTLGVIWFVPSGEWVLLPAILVVPWWVEQRRLHRQMTRELADLLAPPAL